MLSSLRAAPAPEPLSALAAAVAAEAVSGRRGGGGGIVCVGGSLSDSNGVRWLTGNISR